MRVTGTFNQLIARFNHLLRLQENILAEQRQILDQLTNQQDSESTVSVPASLPSLISRVQGSPSNPTIDTNLVFELEVAEENNEADQPAEEAQEVVNDNLSSSSSEPVVVNYQPRAQPNRLALEAIPSPRAVSIGDRVWITNEISHSSGTSRAARTADRSGTVTKVHRVSGRISFETDSGVATIRKVKFLKKIIPSATV